MKRLVWIVVFDNVRRVFKTEKILEADAIKLSLKYFYNEADACNSTIGIYIDEPYS